jgi:hypothetical protein
MRAFLNRRAQQKAMAMQKSIPITLAGEPIGAGRLIPP